MLVNFIMSMVFLEPIRVVMFARGRNLYSTRFHQSRVNSRTLVVDPRASTRQVHIETPTSPTSYLGRSPVGKSSPSLVKIFHKGLKSPTPTNTICPNYDVKGNVSMIFWHSWCVVLGSNCCTKDHELLLLKLKNAWAHKPHTPRLEPLGVGMRNP